MWFGVSKYCSSSKLINAVNWTPASNLGIEVFKGASKSDKYIPSNDTI